MILCMDFTSKKVKITGVERQKKRFRLVTSLEYPLSDLARFFAEDFKRMS